MTELALIALGANLGDPRAALGWARAELARLGTALAASRLYRTAPVGGPAGQPDYLNAAVALQTKLEPEALLAALLNLEAAYGRVRRERWGPRTLDLDLIGYGRRTLHTPELELPHPRAFDRAFVLAPLSDIAPTWQHPATGQTVADALARIDASGVQPTDEAW